MTSGSTKKWTVALLAFMLVSFPALAESNDADPQTALESTPAAQQTAEVEIQQTPKAESTQNGEQTAPPETRPPVIQSTPQPTPEPEAESVPSSEPIQPQPMPQSATAEPVKQPVRVWLENSKDAFSAGQDMKCVLHREGGEQRIEVRYAFNGQTRVQVLETGEHSVTLKLGEAPASDKAIHYELELLESKDYEIKNGLLKIQVTPMAVFGFEAAFAGSVGAAPGESCKIVIRRTDNGARQAAKLALSMPRSAYEAGYRLTGDQKHFQLDSTYYIDFRAGEMEKAVYLSNWSASPQKTSTVALSLQAEKGVLIEEDAAQVNVTLQAEDSGQHGVVGHFLEEALYLTPGEKQQAQVELDWKSNVDSVRLRYEISDGQSYRLEGEQNLNPGQKQVQIPLPTDDFEIGKTYVVNILQENRNDVGNAENSSLIVYAIESSENPTASLNSGKYLIMPGQSLKAEITINKVQPENVLFELSMGEQKWDVLLPAGENKVDVELEAIQEGGTLTLSAPKDISLNIDQAEVVVSAALSDNLNFLSSRILYCSGDGNAQISIKISEPLDESTQFVLGISDDNTGSMIHVTVPAGRREYAAELPEQMMNDYKPGAECQITLDMPDEAWQGKIARATLNVLENVPDLAAFEVGERSAQVGERVEIPLDLPRNFEGSLTLSGPNGGKQTLFPRYPLGSIEVELKQKGRYRLVLSDEKNGWVDENRDEVVITASAQ